MNADMLELMSDTGKCIKIINSCKNLTQLHSVAPILKRLDRKHRVIGSNLDFLNERLSICINNKQRELCFTKD